MTIDHERLLLARFDAQNYANAFIFKYLIVTARHVANDGMPITTPKGDENGYFTFQKHNKRDLAQSRERVPTQGFSEASMPSIGETVWVCGHHGSAQEPFIIESEVIGFSNEGRIIIKRIEGKKFQLGMSGAPVVDAQNRIVGVLVQGVEGKNGEQVFLEPAIVLS